MQTWAVLFDWDGVVVDSSRQHKAAWELFAAEHRLPLPPDHFERSFGMRNPPIIMELLQWTSDPVEAQRLADLKEVLYRRIVDEHGLDMIAGSRRLLDELRAQGVPCAVASSAPRENLDAALASLDLRGHFAAIVSAEDVRRGKPDPEVFLKAAARLGVTPRQACVIEDAHVGIAAARAADMLAVAVATTHSAASLGDADHVVASPEALDAAMLQRWLRARNHGQV